MVYNDAEIEDLGKGFWNSKSKLGIATHYSEMIKLLFGKEMPCIAILRPLRFIVASIFPLDFKSSR